MSKYSHWHHPLGIISPLIAASKFRNIFHIFSHADDFTECTDLALLFCYCIRQPFRVLTDESCQLLQITGASNWRKLGPVLLSCISRFNGVVNILFRTVGEMGI